MRRVILGVLAGFTIAFGEALYTDGKSDLRICVKPESLASIDLPCEVKELYFSNEIQADVKAKAPKSVVLGLKEGEKEGTLTAVCKDYSYTFIIKAGKNCDNHKVVVDRRIQEGKDIDTASFDKQTLLNNARGLMRAMIRGEAVRGYEIKPFNVVSVINNDDYLKASFSVVYDGANLVGLIGKIKNYSKYIDKQIDIPKMMQKGYVLLYVEGMEGERVKLMPQEERRIFIVALKGKYRIPYLEGR